MIKRCVDALDTMCKRVECWWFARHIPMAIVVDAKRKTICCRCGIKI